MIRRLASLLRYSLLTGWVVWKLGIGNVLRVALYRFGLRTRLHPVIYLCARIPTGPYFRFSRKPRKGLPVPSRWRGEIELFSAHRFPVVDVPDWHANPFQPDARSNSEAHWSTIADFGRTVGDIKAIWECSRFEWVVPMAQRAAVGDDAELRRLNRWLADWVRHNPPYRGANWKCGQEASIRVLHLAVAALVLEQVKSSSDELIEMLAAHLERIAPTLAYAIGQQNNHGTSEAAALFIGGTWLMIYGDQRGRAWARRGRFWLEDRARNLIECDGTFSQYSVVYHRLMLDTYCLAEVWRRCLSLPGFSNEFRVRLGAATEWLRQMTDPRTGDAPNIGANDGARISVLTDAPFRDFRPSVQLAAALFQNVRVYGRSSLCDGSLDWLGVPVPEQTQPPLTSRSFDEGGFHVLRRGEAVAYLRYPRFRFRPSQADALHLDLWVGGQNLLRDAGTFSYNTTPEWMDYFCGVSGHNTVQFDGHDQMPRLSRFLFGSWLSTEELCRLTDTGVQIESGAAYRDAFGARHCRRVTLAEGDLQVQDDVDGFARSAVLRWRLLPGDWHLTASQSTDQIVVELCNGDRLRMVLKASVPIVRCEITQGWESRHYLQKTPVPVVELEVAMPGSIITQLIWLA